MNVLCSFLNQWKILVTISKSLRSIQLWDLEKTNKSLSDGRPPSPILSVQMDGILGFMSQQIVDSLLTIIKFY